MRESYEPFKQYAEDLAEKAGCSLVIDETGVKDGDIVTGTRLRFSVNIPEEEQELMDRKAERLGMKSSAELLKQFLE